MPTVYQRRVHLNSIRNVGSSQQAYQYSCAFQDRRRPFQSENAFSRRHHRCQARAPVGGGGTGRAITCCRSVGGVVFHAHFLGTSGAHPPPVASPTSGKAAISFFVLRAEDGANSGSRSVNNLPQPGWLLHTHWRTESLSVTYRPAQGRSTRTRPEVRCIRYDQQCSEDTSHCVSLIIDDKRDVHELLPSPSIWISNNVQSQLRSC